MITVTRCRMMSATCSVSPESESLHEDVRQGRLSDDHREGDREENNPPSNGTCLQCCVLYVNLTLQCVYLCLDLPEFTGPWCL